MLKRIVMTWCVLYSVVIITFGQDTAEAVSAQTEEAFKTETVKTFIFSYLVSGENLKIKVSCPTKGWIGVGFNPVRKMKGANFIIGNSTKKGAFVDDQYGDSPYSHKSDTEDGGKNDILESTCTEDNGITSLTFTIPLNSGDEKDSVLEKGSEITVILAAGKKDDFKKKHSTLAKTKIVF